MKRFVTYIFIIIVLVMTMLLSTACKNSSKDNENKIKNEENIENTKTNEVKGINVGDKLLKYGTYYGIDLAIGSSITLNEDSTFLYKDESTTGEGKYEVSNQEIDEIEGSYNAWVIEFDSMDEASSGKIPVDIYWLFSQTGDISQEQASINFNYKE